MKKFYPRFVAVHLFLIKENSKILMQKRKNTGFMDGHYGVPSGHVEPRESVTEGLIREIQEEIGITLNKKQSKFVNVSHRYDTDPRECEYIDFFFECKIWEGKPKIMEPHKSDDLSWFLIAKLPKNTIPYIRHAIKCYRKGIIYSEFGWNNIISKPARR